MRKLLMAVTVVLAAGLTHSGSAQAVTPTTCNLYIEGEATFPAKSSGVVVGNWSAIHAFSGWTSGGLWGSEDCSGSFERSYSSLQHPEVLVTTDCDKQLRMTVHVAANHQMSWFPSQDLTIDMVKYEAGVGDPGSATHFGSVTGHPGAPVDGGRWYWGNAYMQLYEPCGEEPKRIRFFVGAWGIAVR